MTRENHSINNKQQLKNAETFSKIHSQKQFFILPNAWNGGSAKVFEKSGFKAVGTTSAGVAYSKGYADGELITIDILEDVTSEIFSVIDIPLSVDMERGYGNTIDEIKRSVKRIIHSGAVGINIEDGITCPQPGLEPVEYQIEKIIALKELKEETGIPFVINARTCAHWLNIGINRDAFSEALLRGRAYAEAGADCVFVPGILSEDQVERIVNELPVPVNILITPALNNIDRIKKRGITRLSTGSAPVRKLLSELIIISSEVDTEESFSGMLNHSFSYNEANKYFS